MPGALLFCPLSIIFFFTYTCNLGCYMYLYFCGVFSDLKSSGVVGSRVWVRIPVVARVVLHQGTCFVHWMGHKALGPMWCVKHTTGPRTQNQEGDCPSVSGMVWQWGIWCFAKQFLLNKSLKWLPNRYIGDWWVTACRKATSELAAVATAVAGSSHHHTLNYNTGHPLQCSSLQSSL